MILSDPWGRGGGFNERQNASDLKAFVKDIDFLFAQVEHNSDDELYDE